MKASILTGLPRVDHEAGVVEGGSLDEAVAMNFDLAGVANLRLDDHDCDGTVGDVAAVLQDADPVFTHLSGDEGDTWENKRSKRTGNRKDRGGGGRGRKEEMEKRKMQGR